MKWQMPEKTDWAKSQNAHKPTQSYGEEIYNLIKDLPMIPPPRNVLEIGCAWGVSTLAILMAKPYINLTSVDSDIGNKAISEVKANNLDDRWKFICGKSFNFWEENKRQFDVIYVDGSHLYADVRNDLFEAWKVLRPGGCLFLDDFVHPANNRADCNSGECEYGVSLAAWELIKEEKIKKIDTTTRLLILWKAY